MHVTLLIYQTAEDVADRSRRETAAGYWAAWPDYIGALKAAGVFVDGAGLDPIATAKTVHLDDGMVQDGPFADTHEQLGGYFLIDVPDMATAVTWAARAPKAKGRKVEVRPNLIPKQYEPGA